MTCLFLLNGISSRYFLDEDSQLRTFLEEHGLETNRFQDSHASDTGLLWLPNTVKDFILPAGFPGDKHQCSIFSNFNDFSLRVIYLLTHHRMSHFLHSTLKTTTICSWTIELKPDFELRVFLFINQVEWEFCVIHNNTCFLFFVYDAGSVSDDYLQYMLLQFPTNVTAWICHALVTSSLLKAC